MFIDKTMDQFVNIRTILQFVVGFLYSSNIHHYYHFGL